MPYLLSPLDMLAWRYNVPEMVYPEALIPGRREVGARTTMNLWGNVYPRGGFLHQTDDFKAGAVVAQRAGDVVTRREIGRAAGRERGCHYGEISWVAVSIKKKETTSIL